MSEIFAIKDKLDYEYVHLYREFTSNVVDGNMIHVSTIHVDDFYEIFNFSIFNELELDLKRGIWLDVNARVIG